MLILVIILFNDFDILMNLIMLIIFEIQIRYDFVCLLVVRYKNRVQFNYLCKLRCVYEFNVVVVLFYV